MRAFSITPYGAFQLYGLSAHGLHRGADWSLIRTFAPHALHRIRSACERMTSDQAGYVLFLLDETMRTSEDEDFERWAWELIEEAEALDECGLALVHLELLRLPIGRRPVRAQVANRARDTLASG